MFCLRKNLGLLAALLLMVGPSAGFARDLGKSRLPSLSKLEREFAAEMEIAAASVGNPEKISGVERFRLAFAMPHTSNREQIGRVLFVIDQQSAFLDHLLAKNGSSTRPTDLYPHRNDKVVDLGLGAAKLRMAAACKDCGPALDDFFRIFDIRDAHDGFSGLPFYGLISNRFHEARFQNEVLALHSELAKALAAFEANPAASAKEDLWALATRATAGDTGRAIELLGILTSRDVLITRYLRYLRSANEDFVRAFAMAPLAIRLLGDLTKEYVTPGFDTFTFPKAFKSSQIKNYYYWSSALVSHRMKLLGHSDEKIVRLSLEFPRQYKTLRFLSVLGPLKPRAYYMNRFADAKRVMRSSGAGALHAITENSALPPPQGSVALESFLAASTDARDAAYLLKSELLRLAERTTPANHAYVLFYDFADSHIGLSHIKLVIDGTVYEIHRYPNSKGTYLRSRPLIESLRDARPGALPSGILQIDAAREQLDAITHFLTVEGDAAMKYSFFNQLTHSKAYNCGGILYDALRSASFDLPPLGRTEFLPAFIFNSMTKHLPITASAGKGKYLLENLSAFPNFNRATFWPGGLEPNRQMVAEIGYEFLQAEQKLSERTPLFSNPRKAIGLVLKSYSNTGDLAYEYTPKASRLLEVPTLLIHENDLGGKFVAKSVSPKVIDRFVVEVSGERYYRFFIHPNEWDAHSEFRNRGPPDPIKWVGTPSSSARSFFVRDSGGRYAPFGIKLSLSVVMGGGKRINSVDKLARAVAVNDLIRGVHEMSRGRIPGTEKTWSFLPEEIALMPTHRELGGMIARDLPENFSEKIHLPWFSLIADRKGHDRWIDELFRHSGYKDRFEFVWREFVHPLIEFQTLLAMDNGMTTELHQQNLVLQIDRRTRKVEGFVLRDMDGNWVDYSLRRHLFPGLPVLTDAAADEAKLLRYGEAQANQIFSYRNVIRSRTIDATFKYFLNGSESTDLLQLADQTIIRRFNQRFGELAQAKDLESLEKAWETVHRKTTAPSEKALYAALLNTESAKPTAYVAFTMQLEKTYYSARRWISRITPPKALSARCKEWLSRSP